MSACCKPIKFLHGVNDQGQAVFQVILDPLGVALASPHIYVAGAASVVDATGATVAAPEFADFAAAAAAAALYCACETPSRQVVMQDAAGNPYIVSVDGVTGQPLSAWDVTNGATWAGDLTTLQEKQTNDIEIKPTQPHCVDGVPFFKDETVFYGDDHAPADPPLDTVVLWKDEAGAIVADPTTGATVVTLGACPVKEKLVFTPFC